MIAADSTLLGNDKGAPTRPGWIKAADIPRESTDPCRSPFSGALLDGDRVRDRFTDILGPVRVAGMHLLRHPHYGDPCQHPNPNLGVLETPPFYAAQLVPGDLGTKRRPDHRHPRPRPTRQRNHHHRPLRRVVSAKHAGHSRCQCICPDTHHVPDLENFLDSHPCKVQQQQPHTTINTQLDMIAKPQPPAALRPQPSRKVGQIRMSTSFVGEFWCH